MLVRCLALLFVLAIVVHTNAQDTRQQPKSESSRNSQKDNAPNKQDDSKQDESQRRPLDPDREVREVFFKALAETRSRGEQEFGYLLFQSLFAKKSG